MLELSLGCFCSLHTSTIISSSRSTGDISSLDGSVRRGSFSWLHLPVRAQYAPGSALRLGATTSGWSSLQAFAAGSSCYGGVSSGSASAGAAAQ